MMRRLQCALLAVVAVIGFGSIASAADMPVKARPMAPAPAFSWTGFYIGANVGGSWSNEGTDYSMPFTAAGNIFTNCGAPAGVVLPAPTSPNPFDLSGSCSNKSSSFLGGGQIGYNYQSGAVVYGVEADFEWRRLIDRSYTRFGSNANTGLPMGSVATDTAYFKSEQGSLGTLRGRIGYAPSNWLLYVIGGLAVGNTKHSVTEVLSPGNTCTAVGAGCRNASDDSTKTGWTVGAGAEWAFAQTWSLGVEYLYVDLGKTTLTLAPTGGFFFNTSTVTFNDQSHIARLKLNYRWGQKPAPARTVRP